MFGFKVFVSTLIVIMTFLVAYAGFKAEKNGKIISTSMLVIYALSIVAIWG